MVTGPEHYRLAEELIGYVKEAGDGFTSEGRADSIALAQVHATLAHAAATALAASSSIPDGWLNCTDDIEAWRNVAGAG